MRNRVNQAFRATVAGILWGAMVFSLFGCAKEGDTAPAVESTQAADQRLTGEQAASQVREAVGEDVYANALAELTEKRISTLDGDTYIRLQQNYQGIPVYGRTVVYAQDENGQTLAITGNVADVDETLEITPTITPDQVEAAARTYVADAFGLENPEDVATGQCSDDNLCIYNLDSSGETHLAYWVHAGSYLLLVDANTGQILSEENLLRSGQPVTGDLYGQVETYPTVVYTKSGEEYQLRDLSNQISAEVIQSEQKVDYLGWLNWRLIEVAETSTVETWTQGETPDPAAVDAYANAQIVYDYFAKELDNPSTNGSGENPAEIVLRTGLRYLKTGTEEEYQSYINNAFSLTNQADGISYLVFGVGRDGNLDMSAYLDIVAHEYMHSVEAFHSGMIYSGESGAIMEALSDIFGELVEAWHTQGAPDWQTGSFRNLQTPEETGNPSVYHGEYWLPTGPGERDNGGVHNNSTVISHAAYLMWNGIDGDVAKKISTEDLGQLWYRAMLMMPPNCDFTVCRNLVELAAQSMQLTGKQRQCVTEAFAAVGITGSEEPAINTVDNSYPLSPKCTLRVYGSDGELYDNYTLEIEGQPTIMGPVQLGKDTHYRVSRKISTGEPYGLNLQEGVYTLKITDNAHPEYTYTFTAVVFDDAEREKLELYTPFGASALVSDAFYTCLVEHTGNGNDYFYYHVPQINISGENAGQVNAQIWDKLYNEIFLDEYHSYNQGISIIAMRMSYFYTVKEDILSILVGVYTMWGTQEYFVYNVSASTGKIIPDEALLQQYGLTQDEFYALAQAGMEEKYREKYEETELPAEMHEEYTEMLNNTIAEENVRTVVPYIDPGGDLCIVANIYALAGADSYRHLVNITGETAPQEPWDNVETPPEEPEPTEVEAEFIPSVDLLAVDPAVSQGYIEFLRNRGYAAFLQAEPRWNWDWWGLPEDYAVMDLNNDGVPELLLCANLEDGWETVAVFTYRQETGTVEFIAPVYNYAGLAYDPEQNLVCCNVIKPSAHEGVIRYFAVGDNELQDVMDLSMGTDDGNNPQYNLSYPDGSSQALTPAEYELLLARRVHPAYSPLDGQ